MIDGRYIVAGSCTTATGAANRELTAALNRFLDETNSDAKPFTWTADPDKIVAAVKRGHQLLDSIHQDEVEKRPVSSALGSGQEVAFENQPSRLDWQDAWKAG